MNKSLSSEVQQPSATTLGKDGFYTLDALAAVSNNFNLHHGITEDDVDIVNKAVKQIQGSRRDTPQPGDVVRYTDRYGSFHSTARIESVRPNMPGSVCTIGNMWVFFRNSKETPSFQVGCGGPFVNKLPFNEFKLIGKRKVPFVTHGHLGGCANGALDFEAEVNEWRYMEPNAFYGEYTTEFWRRKYISRCDRKPFDSGESLEQYQYLSDGITFKNEKELNAWVCAYRGKVFDGSHERQKVVFYYWSYEHLISRDEWDALDLPLDTRLCNGIILVKVRYDDENHVVHEYRFTNTGWLDRSRFRPYEMGLGTDQDILAATLRD